MGCRQGIHKGRTQCERDLYGHWWIEFDGESYGWWPSRPVGAWDTLSGVRGNLNGFQSSYAAGAASPTQDIHHGDLPEAMSHPYRRKNGVLKYGKSAGVGCKCISEEDSKDCIRAFAHQFKGKWSWPFGPNCHTFLDEALESCCLRR